MPLKEIAIPLREVLRLRPEQRNSVLLLAAYFFLALASVSQVKSIQNAVYLSKIGFDWRLPSLYLTLAVLAGPIVLIYRYLAKRLSHLLITSLTIVTLGTGLALFWSIISRDGNSVWTYQAFYLWGAIFTVLVPTQGWLFSYQLFPPRTAKHAFVILGAGGVLGGAVGGYYTALTAPLFGTRGLLLHVMGILIVLQFILCGVSWLNRKAAGSHLRLSRPEAGAERVNPLRAITKSRLMTRFVLVILLTGLASTLIDLQYKWALEFRYAGSEASITQFFGGLIGTTFVLSAVAQLLGTGWVLRRFGLGVGLVVLPVALLAGAFGVVATAAFWSIVFAKGIDGTLRTSIEQTSVELLYVPVGDRQTIPLKSFMELVVFRIGDGLGAAFFLVAASIGVESIRIAGAIVVVTAILWIVAALQISDEYANLLRRSLERMGPQAGRRAIMLSEATAEQTIVTALASQNPRKIRSALQLLVLQKPEYQVADFSSLDFSGEMVTLDVSGAYSARLAPPRWLRPVRGLTRHDDPEVAALAQFLMIRNGVHGFVRRLRISLHSNRIPSARDLIYLERYAENPAEMLSPETALQWCESATEQESLLLASVFGATQDRSYRPILLRWAAEGSLARRRAALVAIGNIHDPSDQALLVGQLSENWSRRAAVRALSRYGDSILERLSESLRSPSLDIRAKREIPSILASIDSSRSRGLLVSALYSHDSKVAYRALREMNRIRDRGSDLSYSGESFLPLLQIWAREYYGLLNMDLVLRAHGSSASRLLQKALKEHINSAIEKIFRGLDLFLPHGDAYFSYLGFTSPHNELRENAIELIDSRVRGELRQTLLPIFSEIHPCDVVRKGREIFKLPSDPESVLAEAFFQVDPWLKCCTIGAVACERIAGLKDLVRQACDDINPLVRETAQWALRTWDEQKAAPGESIFHADGI